MTNDEQVAGPTNGRKSPGDYWREIMKDQPIPESIKDFLNQNQKGESTKVLNKKFDPSPNAMRYGHYVLAEEVKHQSAYYNVLT